MGNINFGTRNSESINLYNLQEIPKTIEPHKRINFIVCNFILNMKLKSLQQLHSKKYCNELTRVLSEILQKSCTDEELHQILVKISPFYFNEMHDLLMLQPDKKHRLSSDLIRKRYMCNLIAKFYTKIAHLYAAISLITNPEVITKNKDGNYFKQSIFGDKMKSSHTVVNINPFNFCNQRIALLKVKIPENIPPKLEIVFDDDDQNDAEELPGCKQVEMVPEFIDYYYDTRFDTASKTFTGMSLPAKEQFNKDLKQFYRLFTGEEELPNHINKFSEIPLSKYQKTPFCSSKDVILFSDKTASLYERYAINLKNMMNMVSANEEKMTNILSNIFTFENECVFINETLNEEKLQNYINEAKEISAKLFVSCENDFLTGIKLYEAIMETQMFTSLQEQIKCLKKQQSELKKRRKQKKLLKKLRIR
jgi:hypothetical protein